MGVYWDVLEATKVVIDALTLDITARVIVRKQPEHVPLQSEVPEIIVASNRGFHELVEGEAFANTAVLGYEVYVGLVTEDRHDATLSEKRDSVRQAIRRALWKPTPLVGVTTFDCRYDPNPAEPYQVGPNLEATWMLFTFLAAADRSS
jgi:hypothetical protein